MKLLINLCAQDGIVSHNSGVGTMVKRYIQALTLCLKDKKIEYSLNLITPQYNEGGFGFSSETKKQNENLGNTKIYQVSNGTNGAKFFGSHSNWVELSENTAQILNSINYKDFDKVVTMLNDTPFAGVMSLCKYHPNHKMVWLPHSTAKIHQLSTSGAKDSAFQQRVEWELSAAQYINNHKNCYFGAVGKFIKTHVIKEYGVRKNKTLNLFNGEILSCETKHEETAQTAQIFQKLDKSQDIIMSFGRPEKYKNLDATIKLAQYMNFPCIVITQEYFPDMPYVNHLKSLSKNTKTNLYVNAPFDLPHFILKHYPKKIIFLIPSTKEVSELEINEIRKLNKSNILLVANNIDGMREQIDDGVNGVLVDVDDVKSSTSKILTYFNDSAMNNLTHNSWLKLEKDFDFEKNMLNFLKKLLNPTIKF